MKKFCLLLMSLMALCGCGANHYSVHHNEKLESNHAGAITVDAKQRFLVTSVAPKSNAAGGTVQMRRFCAEPSPDVFTVLSQAASGSGSFGQSAEGAAINAALQMALSSNETGSTIARTQTINMLKEMMYRTCESYLNGQIDDDQYPIIAARNQRVMASILAIEQLTGAITPKTVTLEDPGKEAIVSLDNAEKRVAEKTGAFEQAKDAFKSVDQPDGSCKGLLAKKEEEVAAGDKEKRSSCKDKKAGMDKAELDLKNAQAHYDILKTVAAKSASPSTALAKEAEKDASSPKSANVDSVANAVTSIVAMSFNQSDETSFFCYGLINHSKDGKLKDACADFLVQKIKSDSQKLQTEKQTLEGKQALTRAIGDLSDTDMQKIQKAIRSLDPTAAQPRNLPDAKRQLQSYVRKARTTEQISAVEKAFHDAGIE